MLLLATFQWLINQVTVEVNGCEAYIDDVIIYGNNQSDYVEQIGLFLISCMKEVNVHDNQSDKSEFGWLI